MQRPTIGEIAKARDHCRDAVENDLWPDPSQVDVLLAATEPPTRSEVLCVFASLQRTHAESMAISTVTHFLGMAKP